MALDAPLDYQMERFRAFDSLPETVKRRILADPIHMNPDFIVECGLQNCVLAAGELAMELLKCQSPIEMFLLLAFERYKYRTEVLDIAPQKELICNGKKYRADFVFTYGDCYPQRVEYGHLVVECDGHAFHERTKEQAARDKQRDRDMQAEGYAVLRFTGSEIYRDADKCAKEISDFIDKAVSR